MLITYSHSIVLVLITMWKQWVKNCCKCFGSWKGWNWNFHFQLTSCIYVISGNVVSVSFIFLSCPTSPLMSLRLTSSVSWEASREWFWGVYCAPPSLMREWRSLSHKEMVPDTAFEWQFLYWPSLSFSLPCGQHSFLSILDIELSSWRRLLVLSSKPPIGFRWSSWQNWTG